jgi:hypothetical protein
VSAVKDFFGYTIGQNQQLMEDWKKCTPKDREELKVGLIKNGYSITTDGNAPIVAALASPPVDKAGPNYQMDDEPETDPVIHGSGTHSEVPAAKAA